MKVVVVNLAVDAAIPTPAALLERYHSLSGWSEGLAAAGVTVSVVQRYAREARLQRGGVDYRFCRGPASGFVLGDAVREAVRSCGADVVHVNGLDAPLQPWWLRRALPSGTAIVVQDHAGLPSRAGSLRGVVRRWAMSAVDGFLFTSPEQADPWLASGFSRHRAQVHGVLGASTSLRPIDRATARFETGTAGSPAVLWVGRLSANKDPLAVVDGFERALGELPAATLSMIFEDDTLLPEVRRRVAGSSRLAASVRFVGPVPHHAMARWYSAADLFVLGSHREAAGFAAIEACACGAIPVLTDIPPFHVTTGGLIGASWPPGDSAALAAALIRVARHDLIGQRRAVLAHFEQNLSWSAVARSAIGAYRQALAHRRAGQAR